MQFLLGLLYTTVVILCAFPLCHCDVDHVDVIIIGGGAAGIAAATRLDKHGVKCVLLEAEPHLGGRVHSVPFGDAKVDLGAEWVHGEQGNVVNEMLKDTGLLHHSPVLYRIFPSDREEISEEFSKEILDTFLHIYEPEDGNDNDNDTATADESMGEYFTRRYVKATNKKYSTDEKKRRIALQVLPLLEKHVCSLESSPNWYLPSAIGDHVACPGDGYLHWNGKGYYTALQYLLRDFNATNKVFVNKEVTNIDYSKEAVVVSGEGFSYKADYALFTPSLGVLKHTHTAIFTPPLSPSKAHAIDVMGFGAIAKVWMHFKEPWWLKINFTGLTFVWSCEDRLTLTAEFPSGPKRNGKSWLMDLHGVYGTPQNPNVLSAWFSGEFVPDIEKMADADVIDGIMYALEKFVGHLYTIQRPDRTLRGKWHSNKHFRGTYSYQTVASRHMTGMTPSAIKVLAEPVKSPLDNKMRLYFGGEATNFEHHSTVHGAIESGFREADRLIEVITKK